LYFMYSQTKRANKTKHKYYSNTNKNGTAGQIADFTKYIYLQVHCGTPNKITITLIPAGQNSIQ